MLIALGRTTLLVRDYNEALNFYRDILGFETIHDDTVGTQRYLHLGLPAQGGAIRAGLWMLKPSPEDEHLIGRQAGGHPLLVMYTDDCRATSAELQAKGVRFRKQPADGGGSVFAHFEDVYGNEIILVQLNEAPTSSGKGSPAAVDRAQLAASIGRVSRLEGNFKLRSGVMATEYFDKYRFESDPHLLSAIAESLVSLIPTETEVLAGLEIGGIPLATALSLRTGLPTLFVRKRAKDYGTCQLAEGGEFAGKRLLVVEDVVTSGGQIIASCEELRALGGIITHALCVIDREAGGRDALNAVSVELKALFTRSELEADMGV